MLPRLLLARLASLVFLTTATALHAQVPNTLLHAILGAPGGAAGDQFGIPVAISGTLMVVGAPLDDTGATDAGSAYVYDLSSATPTVPVFTLNNPAPAVNDQFGASVGISGTRVVVGAYLDNAAGGNAGSAYVYDLSSGTPTVPVAMLNEPTPSNSFGFSVGISGSLVVAGANFADIGADASGSAYVYDMNSGTPSVPVFTLNNPSPAAGDRFGRVVGISGTRVVVGVYLDDTGANDTGLAYVYDVSTVTPTVPVLILKNPTPVLGDWFGRSVAISGTRVVVGAYFDNTGAGDAGSAYVYDLISSTPAVPVATLNNPSPAQSDQFGFSVAISGTRVAVGAWLDDAGATDAGSVYVYDLASSTPTLPVATLGNPSPAFDDRFGRSVAISGTTVAVGTPFDDTTATDQGAVYVFGPDSIPPEGGMMTLSPASPIDAGAALTVGFPAWTDASLPLSYTVLIDDTVVSVSGPDASRNITGPGVAGSFTLKGRIADAAGNETEVTRVLAVLTPQESWRRFYFGTTANNGNAADAADPDGDGDDNAFEYVAGLVPTSALSRFAVRAEEVAGQPTQKAIIFGPIVAGRTYAVTSKASLTDATWTPLGSFTTSDNGTERTVTDLATGTATKFYRVEITEP